MCVCVCGRTHTGTLKLLSRVWLCSPMESSPPGSSVHGIFQPRMLEWVAISCSRGSSRPRDLTHVSCLSCIGSWTLYYYAIWGAPLEVLPTPIKGKKGEGIQTGKKLTVLICIWLVKNFLHRKCQRIYIKHLELISVFSKIVAYMTNTQKSQSHF